MTIDVLFKISFIPLLLFQVETQGYDYNHGSFQQFDYNHGGDFQQFEVLIIFTL